jgi:nucleoside-diphosphate-sugar epimerase
MNKDKRILIAGAGGFIGGHLVKALREDGFENIRAVDQKPISEWYSTHSNNLDQRFINLSFKQNGQQLATVLPSDPTVLLPGYYMLFAFNIAGVPSNAQILYVK